MDAMHSNAFRVWQQMGSPEQPSPSQLDRLQKAGQLEETVHDQRIAIAAGKAQVALTLPRQGVAIVRLIEQ